MLVYILAYIASFILSQMALYVLSGLVLVCAAFYLYYLEYKKRQSLINLRGLYVLSFVFGQGLSCMKLSKLQTDWSYISWLCFFLAVVLPYLLYEFLERRHDDELGSRLRVEYSEESLSILYYSIILLSLVSITAFSIEAYLLGFIPFFVRGVPHAYSEFHISGLHYFTVSCVLVPALSISYASFSNFKLNIKNILLLLANVSSMLIPILCVSRFQFIFAIMVALICLFSIRTKTSIRLLIYSFVFILPIYVILTIARSHDIAYLNSIFEMKKEFPIFIAQPYIYIANNYDNFDYLVKHLASYSLGLKGLFPVFALSGLKFLYPSLVDFNIYVVKKELTTLTIIYDAYYDYGIAGVVIFALILGFVIYELDRRRQRDSNPLIFVIYAQIALYMLLSFFTTWFSNPTTYFYLFISLFIYICLEFRERRR